MNKNICRIYVNTVYKISQDNSIFSPKLWFKKKKFNPLEMQN